MTDVARHKGKRIPVTLSLLLAGVAFAGLVSSIIESPQSEAEFLHAHLNPTSIESELLWEAVNFDLPEQDKLKLGRIITRSESSNSISEIQSVLTGQALDAAQKNTCSATNTTCNIPLRLNRRLRAVEVNKDFRVVNIEEKSLRVNLETKFDASDVTLQGISQETRILRFYQTQSGWVNNASEVVDTKRSTFPNRKGQFSDNFSKRFTGLNYYPASASWADFWKKFPLADIQSDLEKAKSLNVNSLRIFLNHNYFDKAETREEGLAKLRTFLDMCESKDIKVLVTFFDLRPNYTLSNWANDIQHIDSVLSNIHQHNAILGIDLKNQPDLDFENWGNGLVEGWLTVMARHVQTQYPNLAITAGWSKAENALRLKDVFDFITYHEYENPEGFQDRLNSIVAAVDEKPVMITELGSTVWHPPFIRRFAESAQAKRLQIQLKQAGTANGVFVWTLNDFDHVGKDVVGPLPWRQAQQRHFGLIRADDTFRPAADILKSFGNRPERARGETNLTHFKSTQKTTF
ncbi:MAG: hypothetical protein ABJN69_09905 [Hellea sp.]